MLLHVFVGDGQLDAVPKDMLQLRLALSGDTRKGGKEFSVSTPWKEGALVRFQHTQVLGQAEDKGTSTIHFSLKGTPKASPATEVTIGEAVLSTYAMERADTKVVMLLPPLSPGATTSGRSAAPAPVGRLSVTLFLNRFAIDFSDENQKDHFNKLSVLNTKAAEAATTTSSREYAFLLNRRLNWKGERATSFNRKIESKLNEDMNGHMKELRVSKQHVDAISRQQRQQQRQGGRFNKKAEPKLAYGTLHPPPPPRSQSPTRRTNMGVGFIAAWPKPPPRTHAEQEQEQISEKLRIAEERRQLQSKQEANLLRDRAHNAQVKADEARLFVVQRRNEDELRRLALAAREETICRLRVENERTGKRTVAMAVHAHFLESQMRTRVREQSQEHEKTLRAKMAFDAGPTATNAAIKPAEKTQIKVPTVKIGRPKVELTMWAAKQRRRANRARRVRERLSILRSQLSQGTAGADEAAAAATWMAAEDSLVVAPKRRFMQSIGKTKLRVPMSASVSEITASILSPPPPPPVLAAPAKVPAPPRAPAAPPPVLDAEVAAAKALERYRLAMQRRQDSALQKVARSALYGANSNPNRSALYGAAYGDSKAVPKTHMRSRSAPPLGRDDDWAVQKAGVAATSRESVLRLTQSSRMRQAAIGGRFKDSEFEAPVLAPQSQQARGRRLRANLKSRDIMAQDDRSVDTETLMREFSREVFKRSAEARARSACIPKAPLASATTIKRAGHQAAHAPPHPKPQVAHSARVAPTGTALARPMSPSKPTAGKVSHAKKPSASTAAIASAWRREARSAIGTQAQKSTQLAAMVDEFAFRGDLDVATDMLQKGEGSGADISGSSAGVMPGFLSTFNQPDVWVKKGDGSKSAYNSSSSSGSVDRDVDEIVRTLVSQQASSSLDPQELSVQAEDEARLAEMIRALETQGVSVESRMLEKVKELKSPQRKPLPVALTGSLALSPMSTLKETLRGGMFGDDALFEEK